MNNKPGLRELFFPIIWKLLYPVRYYLKSFPMQRGKGLLLRYILTPLLPPPDAEFLITVPGNGKVSLCYRETLGLSSLLYGTFEMEELTFVSRFLQQGENAMDIGANVGLFSVVMGKAVGPVGRILAFEPVPSNCLRLQRNIRQNGLENVQVYAVALGASDGTMLLRTAKDAAYHSLGNVEGGFGDGQELAVTVRRLDSVWEEIGRPNIGLVKMDVEGAESDVLLGATDFLTACRPVLLIEANSAGFLKKLHDQLRVLGYQHKHPDGFVVHNHIFYCAESRAQLSLVA